MIEITGTVSSETYDILEAVLKTIQANNYVKEYPDLNLFSEETLTNLINFLEGPFSKLPFTKREKQLYCQAYLAAYIDSIKGVKLWTAKIN
jgi:hypothetical protein